MVAAGTSNNATTWNQRIDSDARPFGYGIESAWGNSQLNPALAEAELVLTFFKCRCVISSNLLGCWLFT